MILHVLWPLRWIIAHNGWSPCCDFLFGTKSDTNTQLESCVLERGFRSGFQRCSWICFRTLQEKIMNTKRPLHRNFSEFSETKHEKQNKNQRWALQRPSESNAKLQESLLVSLQNPPGQRGPRGLLDLLKKPMFVIA